MFLGIVPTVANWNSKGDEFSLILEQNPLVDFVELPEDHPNLLYSNVICGVISGALEMVGQTSDGDQEREREWERASERVDNTKIGVYNLPILSLNVVNLSCLGSAGG